MRHVGPLALLFVLSASLVGCTAAHISALRRS